METKDFVGSQREYPEDHVVDDSRRGKPIGVRDAGSYHTVVFPPQRQANQGLRAVSVQFLYNDSCHQPLSPRRQYGAVDEAM